MPGKKNQGNRILLVEDEETLAIGLEFNLNEEGYIVQRAANGKEALEQIEKENFDLIILDIMLPYLDGFEVAEKIREKYPRLPILMLTARTSAKDRIRGLELGADDYLTKPFHLEELLLRVKGMLKRKAWYQSTLTADSVVRFGENEINFNNLSGRAGKKSIALTAHEAMVLKYLIDNQGTVVSRKELLQNVWHIDSEIETRTIDNFIARLRKYFEPNPAQPVFIKSVRSIGYMFTAEPDREKHDSNK